MTISLNGFVADQNGNAGRLHPDLADLRYTAYMKDGILCVNFFPFPFNFQLSTFQLSLLG
jgi:hypothetical protein